MPALHAYFPSAADRDEAWAFATVDSWLARDGVETEVTANPYTRRANLKVHVLGTFHLTVAFEAGQAPDADLHTLTGVDRSGFSRIRVLSSPDPDNDFDHVMVHVLDLFDRLGPVLVYAADAEQIIADTLPTTVA